MKNIPVYFGQLQRASPLVADVALPDERVAFLTSFISLVQCDGLVQPSSSRLRMPLSDRRNGYVAVHLSLAERQCFGPTSIISGMILMYGLYH